jgi:hypothetical protein
MRLYIVANIASNLSMYESSELTVEIMMKSYFNSTSQHFHTITVVMCHSHREAEYL